MLFLWTFDQRAEIARLKTRITASEDAVCGWYGWQSNADGGQVVVAQ